MRKKIYDTIIIGCGIAGLGCAHTLRKHNKDFLIITEDIGGRICTSKDGKVNYGAYYVGKDYHHVLPYVKKRRRFNPLDAEFHKNKKSYFVTNGKLLKYPLQFLKLLRLVMEFKRVYTRFKKSCEHTSQKKSIKANKYLLTLYQQRATDFITKHKIKDIVDEFAGEFLYGCTFSKMSELSAFTFLHFALYLFVPVYDFTFLKKKAIAKFKKRIKKDTVVKFRKHKKGYQVITPKRAYQAKHLVLATPIHISQKLLKLKKIKKPVQSYMFHLRGTPKPSLKGQEELFQEGSKTIAIAHQYDGSYLFYSENPKPAIKKYFKKHKIIAKKHWNPAFNLKGNILLDCEQGKNLYMVGDHNICGLEDSYITGIYAANQIINKS